MPPFSGKPALRAKTVLRVALAAAAALCARETPEERQQRVEEAIDRLEDEGWADEEDLAALREAAERPEAHCAFLDAWLDEPACPAEEDDDGPDASARLSARRSPDGEDRLDVSGNAGPFSGFWRGSPERPWQRRGIAWESGRWRVRLGNWRAGLAADRGGLRRARADGAGTDFFDPGAPLLDGAELGAPLGRFPLSAVARVWEDGYGSTRDGRAWRARGAELGLEGSAGPGRWTAAGAVADDGGAGGRWRLGGEWKSPASRLWASWSPAPEDSAFALPRRPRAGGTAARLFRESAAAAVLARAGHRLELAALGPEWASADLRWPGAPSSVRSGYRYARGPLLFLAAEDEWRPSEGVRGSTRWSASRADSSARWRARGSLRRARGGLRPGAELSLSGGDRSGTRRALAWLELVFPEGFSVRAKGGASRKSGAGGGIAGSGPVAVPAELLWRHGGAARKESPEFLWKLSWNDAAERPDDVLLSHRFAAFWESGSCALELRLPLGSSERGTRVGAEATFLLGRRRAKGRRGGTT